MRILESKLSAPTRPNWAPLAQPVFDEGRQAQSLLRALLVTLFLASSAATVFSLLADSSNLVFILVDIFFAISCAALLLLLVRGYELAATRGVIGMIFISITVIHPFLHTGFGVELAGYALVVALAGALLDRRSLVLITLASILAIVWAGSLRYPGGLSNSAAQFDVISYSVLCASVAAILFFSRRGSRVALERAEQDAQQLAQEVVQRTVELIANEHYFESLINASQDAMVFVDPAGVIKFESPSIESLLGYKIGERLGRNMAEYGHPDDLAFVQEAMRRQLQSGRSGGAISLRALHADGHWVDTECTGKFVRDKDTQAVLGMVVSMRDATLRKQSEAAIEQRSAFEKLMVDISTRLLSLPMDQSEAGIRYALQRLGEFTAVDLAQLIRLDLKTRAGATIDYWPVPDREGEQANPWADVIQTLVQTPWQMTAPDQDDRLVALLSTQGFATVRDTAAVAHESDVAAHLWRLNVRSCLAVAVMQDSDAILVLALEMFGAHADTDAESKTGQMIGRAWSDDHVRLTQLVGQLISSTLLRHQTFARLARQTATQQLVAEVSNRIASSTSEELDNAVQFALQRLGEFTRVDIARLFFFNAIDDISHNTHEWLAPGIASQQPLLQDLRLEDGWWIRNFQSQQVIWFHVDQGDSALDEPAANMPATCLPPAHALSADEALVRHSLQQLGVKTVFGVGLLRDGQVVGELGLDTLHHQKEWTDDEIRLVQLVAEAVGGALLRKQSNAALQHRLAFERLLADISGRFMSVSPEQTDDAINETLRQLGEFMGVDYARIFLLHPDDRGASNRHEWTAEGMPSRRHVWQDYRFQDADLVWYAYLRQHRHIYFTTLDDMPASLNVYRAVLEQRGPRSRATASLWRGDTMIGAMSLDSLRVPVRFTPENIQLVQVVAEIISNALNRKRSYEQIQQRLAFEHLVSEISARFNAAAHDQIDDAIQQALKQISEFTGMDVARLFLISEDRQVANNTHEWCANPADSYQSQLQALPMSDPGRQYLYERLLEDGMIYYENVHQMPPEYGDLRATMVNIGIRSFLDVLLRRGDETIGDLGLSSQRTTSPFVAENLQLMRVVSELISNVLTRKQAAEKMSQLTNALAAERNQLEDRVAERTKELERLLDVAKMTNLALDLPAFETTVMRLLQTVIPFEVGAIWELDADNHLRELSRFGSNRVYTPDNDLWTYLPDQDIHLREMIERQAPVVIDDIFVDEPFAAAHLRRWIRVAGQVPAYVRSSIYVPLISHERVTGLLVLHSSATHFFDPPRAALAQAFASQVAVAIENAALHEQKVHGAAMAERSRLARELHDSVSQALFGVVLGARTAIQLAGNTPSSDAMQYVLKLSEAALAEMRVLIYELRPESLATEGLLAALRRQASALLARHNLQVDLQLDQDEPALPIKTKEALYRIGVEAVQNTIKHASATKVVLTLRAVPHESPAEVILQVEDNGRGFDQTQAHPGHFGLVGMHERAENIGAQFHMTSQPGRGTRIEIRVPFHARQPAASIH